MICFTSVVNLKKKIGGYAFSTSNLKNTHVVDLISNCSANYELNKLKTYANGVFKIKHFVFEKKIVILFVSINFLNFCHYTKIVNIYRLLYQRASILLFYFNLVSDCILQWVIYYCSLLKLKQNIWYMLSSPQCLIILIDITKKIRFIPKEYATMKMAYFVF